MTALEVVMEQMEMRLLTVQEVARRLSVCVRTVRTYVAEGMLPVVRLGRGRRRAVRVEERALAEFVKSLRSGGCDGEEER
jgi:excisionase family DNA binding protein